MEYVHKLPFILGTLIAIIVGLFSYKYGIDRQETYLRMTVSMILFFVIGLLIRGSLLKIIDELKEKKEEEKRQEEESGKQNKDSTGITSNEDIKPSSRIDYKIDDDDNFSPLTISEVIRSEINKK